MIKTRHLVNLAFAVVLAILRATGHKSEAFQAVAHLYEGGLFAAYVWGGDRFYLDLFVGLAIIETLCFFALGNR